MCTDDVQVVDGQTFIMWSILCVRIHTCVYMLYNPVSSPVFLTA